MKRCLDQHLEIAGQFCGFFSLQQAQPGGVWSFARRWLVFTAVFNFTHQAGTDDVTKEAGEKSANPNPSQFTHFHSYLYIYIHTGLSCRGRTDTVHAEIELPSAETSSLLKLLSSTYGDGQYVTLHGSPSARNIILQPLSYVCPAAGSFHFISPKPSSNTKRWMTTNGMPHLLVRF